MPELLVQEVKSALEAFATGLQRAATREEFDALLDDWIARGFPEAEAYRGGFNRRGEIIAEAMKTMRALDGDARAMAEAERDRLPVFESARRLANGAALGAIAAESTWPVTQAAQPGEAFELADIAKMAIRVAPRLAGGAATALAWLLTPLNSQGSYRYWGADGDHRVLIPPGDLTGRVERRDYTTGEWQPTGEVAREEWKDGRPVGLVIEPADAMWPEPAPSADRGFVPPAVPDTSREIYPATSPPAADRESFPSVDNTGDTEVFPIPEAPGAQASVFLALSDEIIRDLTGPLEAHRGDAYTRRGNDIVARKVYDLLTRWFPEVNVAGHFEHDAGATKWGRGMELKERIVRNDNTGAYSIPDIIIRDTETGRLIALNTGVALRDGRTMIADERRQLQRLRNNLGAKGIAAALPKLRPGMNEAEYESRVEDILSEFFTEHFGRPPGGRGGWN